MTDKHLHFVGGFIISLVASFFFGNPVASFLAALLAGLAKEYLYDAKRPDKHTVEMLDWLATAAGGLLASILFYVSSLQ